MLSVIMHQVIALVFGFFLIYVMLPPIYNITLRCMADFFKATDNRSHMIAGILGCVLFFLAMRLLLPIAGLPLEHMTIVTGIVLTAIGISFRSFAINSISYFYILFYDEIHVGDFIKVEGVYHEIESIQSQFFVLKGINENRETVRLPLEFFLSQTTWTMKGTGKKEK